MNENDTNSGFKPRRRGERIAVRLSLEASELVRDVEQRMNTSASSATEWLIVRGYKVWLDEQELPASSKTKGENTKNHKDSDLLWGIWTVQDALSDLLPP